MQTADLPLGLHTSVQNETRALSRDAVQYLPSGISTNRLSPASSDHLR